MGLLDALLYDRYFWSIPLYEHVANEGVSILEVGDANQAILDLIVAQLVYQFCDATFATRLHFDASWAAISNHYIRGHWALAKALIHHLVEFFGILEFD